MEEPHQRAILNQAKDFKTPAKPVSKTYLINEIDGNKVLEVGSKSICRIEEENCLEDDDTECFRSMLAVSPALKALKVSLKQ